MMIAEGIRSAEPAIPVRPNSGWDQASDVWDSGVVMMITDDEDDIDFGDDDEDEYGFDDDLDDDEDDLDDDLDEDDLDDDEYDEDFEDDFEDDEDDEY